MKTLVINGSPKADKSTTLFASLYIEKVYGEAFCYFNIGPDPEKADTDALIREIEQSDLIVFSYPVYTFLVPYQLHAVIEKLSEAQALKGKYVTQITTSKHFFDTTAHRFIKDNAGDMDAKYIPGISLDMEDILHEKGRRSIEKWYEYILFSAENDIHDTPLTVQGQTEKYICNIEDQIHSDRYNAVIVTDSPSDNTAEMIKAFSNAFRYKTEVIDIAQENIRGGCTGCLRCAFEGKCIYHDDFQSILENRIHAADIIIYAADIINHSLGSKMKMYDDRQFCNGHRTVTMGAPTAYILSGCYSKEENLRTVIQARADVGRNFLAGVATDEGSTSDSIKKLAASCEFALENATSVPQTFYGTGGLKIFRDMIYIMQGFMKEDHAFYRKNGFYDFPQKEKSKIFKMKLAGLALSSPKIRRKIGGKLDDIMLEPYRKVIEEVPQKK